MRIAMLLLLVGLAGVVQAVELSTYALNAVPTNVVRAYQLNGEQWYVASEPGWSLVRTGPPSQQAAVVGQVWYKLVKAVPPRPRAAPQQPTDCPDGKCTEPPARRSWRLRR